jgi:riboflavin biosynthesis pyrimidine reductase
MARRQPTGDSKWITGDRPAASVICARRRCDPRVSIDTVLADDPD